MITNANALPSALAHLLTSPVGNTISMDVHIRHSIQNFKKWGEENNLGWQIEGKKLTLWRKA